MIPEKIGAWDDLIGVLVGVVRAEQKNAGTPDTDEVLFAGFEGLMHPEDEAALQNAAKQARAEKNRIAPDCAFCAMPCGSTSDLDFSTVRNARDAVREEKFALVHMLMQKAPMLRGKLKSGVLREDERFAFHKAVFVLGEDMSPKELLEARKALEDVS